MNFFLEDNHFKNYTNFNFNSINPKFKKKINYFN